MGALLTTPVGFGGVTNGDARTQYLLGFSYELGRFKGFPQSFVAASKWYRLAAEQGEKEAQFGLARCLANGTGVIKDLVEAMRGSMSVLI